MSGPRRGHVLPGSGEVVEWTPEQLEFLVENDSRGIATTREALAETVRLVGGSPVEAQIEFLKGLVANPPEAQAFISDPKSYAVAHGILLDPDVVKEVVNATLFDVTVDPGLVDRLGLRAASGIIDMRASNSVAAVPAAVAAGAAAVAAAAAVVEAVVTLVRTKRVEDLLVLKGLGPNGIVLPGGAPFRF